MYPDQKLTNIIIIYHVFNKLDIVGMIKNSYMPLQNKLKNNLFTLSSYLQCYFYFSDMRNMI